MPFLTSLKPTALAGMPTRTLPEIHQNSGRCFFCRQIAFAAQVRPATSRALTSCGQPVLVIRPLAIVEDRVLLAQMGTVGLQPRIDVFRADRDDAAVMPSRRDLRRRLIRDRRERQQPRLARLAPV